MPQQSYLQRLKLLHSAKVNRLASIRGEIVRQQALARRAEDAVDIYRKAVARETRRRLQAKRRQRESSEEPVPERLAIEDEKLAEPHDEEWAPTAGTWKELEELFDRLKRTPPAPGAACCGLTRNQALCGRTDRVHRVSPPLLKAWPIAWGREKVSLLRYPLLCNSCNTRWRRMCQ